MNKSVKSSQSKSKWSLKIHKYGNSNHIVLEITVINYVINVFHFEKPL